MLFGYEFASLDEAQKAQRRNLLDSYGLIAQLSAFAVLFSFQVYFLLCWLCRDRLQADEELVPRSPHEKSFKRGDGEWVRRGRRFWRVTCWWATESVSPGWGTKGQWATATVWTAWLMFLCVHRTSNDYFHLTKRFGIVGASQLPLHYLLAMRSPWSPVQILTRLPHEQLNVAHQILGRITTLLFCLHGSFYLYFFVVSGLLLNRLGNRVVILGLVGLFLFIFMSSTALGYLRTRNYRVFFAVHITLAPILPVVLFWHVSHLRTYIWEVVGVYILMMVTRSRNIGTYPGTVSMIPGTNLIKMDIPLASDIIAQNWKPGQHIYVSLPATSKASPTVKDLIRQRYRTNPFTIASLPHEDGRITLVARTLDGNTKRLAALARSLCDQADDDKNTPSIAITIEGPYGASSRLPDLASYDYVLLLAGGVGATFVLPVFRSIMGRSHWPSPAAASPQIRFVWTVRRLAEVRWAFPAAANSGGAAMNVGSNAEVEVYVTQNGQGLHHGAQDGDLEMAEGVNLLHTGDEAEKIGGSDVKHGRPDLKRIVDGAFAQPRGKVAVLVCGPKRMMEDTRELVGRWVRKGRDVYWHAEAFGL